MNKHQQGDVLFHRIDALPSTVKPVSPKNGRYVVAEGEATGHAHVFCEVEKVNLFQDTDVTVYLEVIEETSLTHNTHNPHTFAPGLYETGIVVEDDPWEKEIRRVSD